jgi:alkanesulfonate monooxygenase SsuD/methylene tetrahydromethanopterin reductase-like flavin-dependent oxidoreductase (luciferase family)
VPPVGAALAGFKAVDAAQVLAGPTACRILAEYGAEVIQINNPHGHASRAYHYQVDSGKRTIELDLKRPGALDVFWKLIEQADVLSTNFSFRVAERLGRRGDRARGGPGRASRRAGSQRRGCAAPGRGDVHVEVGLSIAPRFLPSKPQPLLEVYRDFIDDVVYAEQLGFDRVYATEHHFAPDGWSPSELTILANIAGRTSTIRLGTSLFLLPFHHPLRVAEDVATVDLLSGGRLDEFAVGAGSVQDEFDTFGLDSMQRWGRLFEALHIIRRCFTEERFDHHGKYFNFPNVRMTTKPMLDPFPLWVGGYGPKLVERAGREGYHWQRQGPNPDLEAIYLKGLRDGGHDTAKFRYHIGGVVADMHLSDTTERAWDDAEAGIYWRQEFYRSRVWISWRDTGRTVPPLPPQAETRTHPIFSSAVVGSPDDVLKRLEKTLKDSDSDRVAWIFRHAGMDNKVVRHSLDLFARHVMLS